MKLDESDDEELQFQNLNMFKKMGKGLKKFEEKAKAIAAPKNHDKYAPKLAKGYKTFNTEANKMGGWGTVDKAAEALQAVGLQVLHIPTTEEYYNNLARCN